MVGMFQFERWECRKNADKARKKVGRQIFMLIIFSFPLHSAKAQKPILVHNQDTTYFIEVPMLDSVTVTAKRTPVPNTLDHLITWSELNTSVSGLTKDLQRDLPSMIRIYTPQGIPLLTKYTSNHSLTSTIPDSAVFLELREPGAKYPNPDAPVIIQPEYRHRASISLSPLYQTVSFATGSEKTLSTSIGLTHSSAPEGLENLIPELQAYSTTYSGYGALNVNFNQTRTEVIILYSRSDNEYGNLLNIEKLKENEESTNIFINAARTLGKITLGTEFAYQNGWEYRYTEELNTQYKVINRIDAFSYTAAISNEDTEFRVNLHNLQRVYSYGDGDIMAMQRFETLLTRHFELSPSIKLNLETRFDYKDQKPSLSSELLLQASRNSLISLNAAHLYDAVGSEGLNNLMNSIQLDPHPWEVTYARLGIRFYAGRVGFNPSFTAKKARLGWYGQSASTQGWIARLAADGMVNNNEGRFYLLWNFEGVRRELSLDITDQPVQLMPGPARLEAHAGLEAGVGNMKYVIQSNVFIDRQARITESITNSLGSQYFLSFAVSRLMNQVELGIKLVNSLALLDQENKILGYYSQVNGLQYVSAPPFVNLILGINF